jgi:hypothetical protein
VERGDLLRGLALEEAKVRRIGGKTAGHATHAAGLPVLGEETPWLELGEVGAHIVRPHAQKTLLLPRVEPGLEKVREEQLAEA